MFFCLEGVKFIWRVVKGFLSVWGVGSSGFFLFVCVMGLGCCIRVLECRFLGFSELVDGVLEYVFLIGVLSGSM